MKGLLIKDRYICLRHMSAIVLTAVCLFISALLYEYPSVVDMIGYIMALGLFFSCLNDEERTGYSYLMSMPVAAKAYVIAKNVFVGALLAFFWLCARIAIVAGTLLIDSPGSLRISSVFGFDSVAFLFAMSFASAAVPFVLRFGSLKAFYILILIPWLFCVYTIFDSMFAFSSIERLLDFISGLSTRSHALLFIGCIAVNALLVGLFIALGIRVMKKKDF